MNVMRYVIEHTKDEEQEKLLSVIRMEIDYELLSLHDAIKDENTKEVLLRKKQLIQLVGQLKYVMEYR